MLHMWRDIPVMLASIVQTIFAILYLVPKFGALAWWKEPIGRSLAAMTLTFMLLVDVATLGYIVNMLQGADIKWNIDASNTADMIVVIGYWVVCAAIVLQCYTLVVVRYDRYKRRKHNV